MQPAPNLKKYLERAKVDGRTVSETDPDYVRALDADAAAARDASRSTRTTPPPQERPDPDAGRSTREGERPDAQAGRAPAIHLKRQLDDASIVRAAWAYAEKRWDDPALRDRRYRSDQLAERRGNRPQGFLVPFRDLLSPMERHALDLERRGLEKGTTGAGLVSFDQLGDEFIAAVRTPARVIAAGARVLSGLVADAVIGRMDVGAAHTWLATETTDLTADTAQDINTYTLSPKTCGIRVDASRKMRLQSIPALDEVVAGDIRAALGSALDLAALAGSGASGQPLGIVGTAGVGAVNIEPPLTWADAVEFISDVAGADLLDGRLAYIVHSDKVSVAMTTSVDTGSGRFIMEREGGAFRIAGFPAFISNNVGTAGTPAAGRIIFGNWAEVFIGQWGEGLDLFGDIYTLGNRGGLVIRGFIDVDIFLRHPASFSVGAET